MSDASLRAALAEQARDVAALLKSAAGDRALRRRARATLVRAFALAEPAPAAPPGPDTAESAPEDPAVGTTQEVARALREIDALLLELRGVAGRGLRPLRLMWIRTPWHEHIRPPRAATAAVALVAAIEHRAELPTAIDQAHIDWFEARCQAADPGLLRPIQVQDGKQSGQRMMSGEMELIRKRGSSRFS